MASLAGNQLLAAPLDSGNRNYGSTTSSQPLVWRTKRFEDDAAPAAATPATRPQASQPAAKRPEAQYRAAKYKTAKYKANKPAPVATPPVTTAPRQAPAPAAQPYPSPSYTSQPRAVAAQVPVEMPVPDLSPQQLPAMPAPTVSAPTMPTSVLSAPVARSMLAPPAMATSRRSVELMSAEPTAPREEPTVEHIGIIPAVAEASDTAEVAAPPVFLMAPPTSRVARPASRPVEAVPQRPMALALAPTFPQRTPSRLPMADDQQSMAPSLEVDCDAERAKLKHISSLTASAPIEPGDLPPECGPVDTQFHHRDWNMTTFTWKASNLCHKPLYFEEVRLERYGHALPPPLQPLASGAVFFANVAVLPYKMGVSLPNECIYTLGYYRPGSCAPYHIPGVPISARGALFEAAAVAGIATAVPGPLPVGFR